MKKKNGITLIALVITIIVLLILAGVSLSLVVGEEGIIKRGITASKTYDIAGAKEQVELLVASYAGEFYQEKYIVGNNEHTNIADYISSKLNGQNAGDYDVTTVGRKVTVSKGDNVVTGKILDDGSINWGKSWEYATEDGKIIITDGNIKLGIGDKVNYNPQSGATKTTETSNYLFSSWQNDQKFYLMDYNYGWQVMGVDEESNQILLVAEEFVGPRTGGYTNTTYNTTYYYFDDGGGYLDGIGELNKISALYGQGKNATGARSMNLTDVMTLAKFFDPECDENDYIADIVIDDPGIRLVLFGMTEAGCDRGLNYYFAGSGAPAIYWLASKSSNEGDEEKFLYISSTGFISKAEYSGSSPWAGVRPVVTLEKDIEFKKNQISGEWDFVE